MPNSKIHVSFEDTNGPIWKSPPDSSANSKVDEIMILLQIDDDADAAKFINGLGGEPRRRRSWNRNRNWVYQRIRSHTHRSNFTEWSQKRSIKRLIKSPHKDPFIHTLQPFGQTHHDLWTMIRDFFLRALNSPHRPYLFGRIVGKIV